MKYFCSIDFKDIVYIQDKGLEEKQLALLKSILAMQFTVICYVTMNHGCNLIRKSEELGCTMILLRNSSLCKELNFPSFFVSANGIPLITKSSRNNYADLF